MLCCPLGLVKPDCCDIGTEGYFDREKARRKGFPSRKKIVSLAVFQGISATNPRQLNSQTDIMATKTKVLRVSMYLKKKPGLTEEEFNRYWSDVHGPLVRPMVEKYGILKYTQVS